MASYKIYTITEGGESMMVHRCFFHHHQIYTSFFTINKAFLVVARQYATKTKKPMIYMGLVGFFC
jgi:hypothetical protein